MAGLPPLLLRVDGGPSIGGGHVMRCLALAQGWTNAGGSVSLCAADLSPGLRRRLADERLPRIDIAAAAGSADDADATLAAARSIGAPVVVIDGYRFSAGFRRTLHAAGLRLAAIDDLGSLESGGEDLIVNPNPHAIPALYPAQEGRSRLLLGLHYALLRREFLTRNRPAPHDPAAPPHLLVTLGAADPGNVTARVIDALKPEMSSDTRVTVVIGGINPHRPQLDAAGRGLAGLRLLSDPGAALPDVMAAADLAICAGGGTMWELAYLGVPFLPVVIAENQRPSVAAMARQGYVAMDADRVERDLPAMIASLSGDAGRRRQLSELGRRLVDGKGVERVCAALRDLTG